MVEVKVYQSKDHFFVNRPKDSRKNLDLSGDFTANNGWLGRWLKRYGIRLTTVSGEALSANKEDVEAFKSELHKLIDAEGISGEQLYNADETGLNYKMLPKRTYATAKEENSIGYKMNKERVTILCSGNVTGNHKMRLTLVGKSAKPRSVYMHNTYCIIHAFK